MMLEVLILLAHNVTLLVLTYVFCVKVDRLQREFLNRMYEIDVKFRGDLIKILIKYLKIREEYDNDAK